MEENKPWYRRVWGMTLLVVFFLILLGSIFFMRQVYVFYKQLKEGKQPAFLVERRFSGTPNAVAKPDIDLTAVLQKARGKSDEPFSGPASSSHEIVEFLDFDCPYSKSALGTVHDIIRTHPEIKIVIRDYPLTDIHPDAEQAALAARCVWRQGKPAIYWKYHDLLFANQDRHDADSLKEFAYQAGVDSRFETCMQTSQTAGILQQSMIDATGLGISVTPTFFVDGQMVEGAADAQYLLNLIK